MNEIVELETAAISLYEITPDKVAELAEKYVSLELVPDDKNSYRACKSGLMELVHCRTAVDKRRKELGEKARKYVNDINQVAKVLLAPLVPHETRLRIVLDDEDARVAQIIEDARLKEAARVDGIRVRIAAMRAIPLKAIGKTWSQLDEIWKSFVSEAILEDVYGDFLDEALQAKAETTTILTEILDKQRITEETEATQKAERDRLEKIHLDQESEAKRLAERQKQIDEENQRIQDENAEAVRIAEQSIREEREKFEAEKQAEQDRKDREAIEIRLAEDAKEQEQNAVADQLRQEALRPDKEKLLTWVNTISDIVPPALLEQAARDVYDHCRARLAYVIEMIRTEIDELN